MKHVLAAIVLAGLLLFLMTRTVSDGPYTYDEADYMWAASLGVFANWSDTPTLPMPEFVRAGLNRSSDTAHRQALSETVRASNDMVFYRHWHGPLYQYFLIPVSHLFASERSVRMAMLLIPVLSLLTIYF